MLAEHGELLHDHQTSNLLSPLVNLPHGETCAGDDSGESSEQASSDSQVPAALVLACGVFGALGAFLAFSPRVKLVTHTALLQ